jgi:hypothetical protein
VDKPVEALNSFSEADDECNKGGDPTGVQQREVQELKLKFEDEDDDKHNNTSQYIFANARRLPMTPGYNAVVEENLPVVSELDSNFSRQVRLLSVICTFVHEQMRL